MKQRLAPLAALVVIVTAAVTLAGCGSSTKNTGSPSSDVNKTDVAFVDSMVPHHQQAVRMATMAKAHASSAQVKKLADEIEAAQGPEIEKMQGWLEDWGRSSADGSTGHMEHDSDSRSQMPGMMSAGDMTRLSKATGPAFDRLFLTMMIAHHEGAIEMARTERAQGENADVKALAKRIESAQKGEVTRMRTMLGS